MSTETKVFPRPTAVAQAFAEMLLERSKTVDRLNIALSGGSTPKLLFDILAADFKTNIDWKKLHFYWGDERCVPPNHEDSNYLMTRQHLFDHIDLPKSNVHRILGEDNPSEEAENYGTILMDQLPMVNELPQFDLIMLGLGEDGHTASIFPHQMELLTSDKICAVANHPTSGQKRITLTGPVINKAKEVAFLVTGSGKKEKVKTILQTTGNYEQYPAAHILPESGRLIWWMDEAAAG
jgi:6-phosphogluconolactonase